MFECQCLKVSSKIIYNGVDFQETNQHDVTNNFEKKLTIPMDEMNTDQIHEIARAILEGISISWIFMV